MSQKKNAYSRLGKYFVPGFVLMSVMVGGGFATGREIVQYGGRFGAQGWLVGLAIAIGFSVLCMIAFEIARMYKAYDYRTHLKVYAGPLTYLFDLIFFVLALLVMAVMASATGNILQETVGLPYYAGVITIVAISAVLSFFGKGMVERFAVWGALALYVGYITFAALAIAGRTDNIARVFAEGDVSYMDAPAGVFTLIWVGLVYVGYNIQPLSTAFFTVERIHCRKDALISGFIAGFIILIPWALTYIALMAYYPSAEVMGATVPWLYMMMDVHPAVVLLFGVVAGWTLIATTVGVMNAMTNRIDAQLAEKNKPPLKAATRTLITLAYLVGAMAMSRIGIIALVDKGYGAMAYGMMISFMLPLITVGLYKVITNGKGKPPKK